MTPAARWTGPAALVAATVAWGSTIVTIKVAARGVPVATIAVIEVLAALAVLGAVLAYRCGRPRRPPVALVVGGLLEPGLAYPLLNAGLARTSGTHGALLIGLESVIVVLLGAVSDRRAPSRRTLIALGLAAIGAASLVGGAGGAASASGDLLVTAGVGCAAGYVVIVRRQAAAWDPVELTAYQFAAGSLAILPITAISLATGSGAVLGSATGWEIASAVTAGVVGSAVAFLLYNWALGRVPTALAGTSLTLIPLFGVAFSVAFLAEALTARTVVAACAVLAGVVLATSADPQPARRPLAWLRRSATSAAAEAVKAELAELAFPRSLASDTLDLSVLPPGRRGGSGLAQGVHADARLKATIELSRPRHGATGGRPCRAVPAGFACRAGQKVRGSRRRGRGA